MERYQTKNRTISNTLYNLSLDRCNQGDLYGASILLKKALRFYKSNFEARNLLGLIFYNVGEVCEAIIQWTISKNFQPYNNNATYFLEKVQKDNDTSNLIEAIKNYNMALDNANVSREDLAMVYLYKAIELNPNYVKAYNLLGLLLLKINDNIKAGSYFLKAKNIDNGNFYTNRMMEYVVSITGKKEIKERKIENVFSIKKLDQDDAVLPRKYIKLTTRQKVLWISIGIIVGVLSYITIVLPMINKNEDGINKRDTINFAEKLNEQNKVVRDLTLKNEVLQEYYDTASVRLKAYEEQNKLFTTQYETLTEINELFDGGYISKAAKMYVDLDKENITDETLIGLLNTAKSKIEGLGAKRLCELGTQSWNGGNKTQAISYYQLSLSINPDDPETMFLLARLYQNLSRNREANELFDKIIGQHPESNYAKRSRDARGY